MKGYVATFSEFLTEAEDVQFVTLNTEKMYNTDTQKNN